MRASLAGPARDEWRGALVEGLIHVVEAFFLLTLVVLPLDAYLVLPSGRVLGFLSQALTIEMCALFGLTLGLGAALRRPASLPVRWRELVPLTLALLAGLASVPLATSPAVALKECLKIVVYLGIFMVARALKGRPHIRYYALLALLVGLTLTLIVGFFNAVPGTPDIAGALLDIHRTVAALPNSTVVRAEASFRYPNELAAYLLLIIPLLIACAVTTSDLAERVGFLLLGGATGTLLLLTYTRGAQLAAAVALVALLWFLAGRRLAVGGLALLISGALALAFIPGPTSARLISAVTNSDNWQVFRLDAWRWAFSIFLRHPFLGVGLGNISLQPNAPFISAAQGLRELDAENLLLNVLAETGVVGALAVLACLIAALRLAADGLRRATTWLDRAWNAATLAALVGVLVYGLTDPVLVSGQVTGLLCALVGLAGVSAPVARRVSQSRVAVPAQTEWLAPAAASAHTLPRLVFLLNSREVGGAELHTVNLAAELRYNGAETLIVIPPAARVEALLRERGLSYRVERLGMNVGRWKGFLGVASLAHPLSAARCASVVGALAAERDSVFICPFPREQATLARLKRRRALRVVWIMHAPLHYAPHRLIIQPMLVARSHQANLIVAVSETLAQRLAAEGYATERLSVIPNAVAVTPGPMTPFERRPPATIGFAGRLTRGKGLATLIAAMPAVLKRWPEARLLIAGTGPREAALRRQVVRLGLSDVVTFQGQVNDIYAFYRQLTVLAHPTMDHEGLPTVILEAHNAALPVVASAVAGVTEVVRDDETGLLAEPGDANALAQRIIAILDEPALARRLGLAGWRQTRARYTLNHTADDFASAIAGLDDAGAADTAWPSIASGGSRVAQRSRFLRDTGILLVGKLLTALATALWTVLAARSLSATSYGDLMLCVGMIEIAAVVTDAGLTAAATQALTTATASQARRLAGTVLWLKLALGVLAAGLAIGATIALPFTPEARHLMLLLAPGLLFIAFTSLSLLFRARLEPSYTLIASLIGAVAGGYGAFSVYLAAPTAGGFARARLLMLVVTGGLTLILVALRYRPSWAFDWQAARRLLRAAAPLGLALTLNILYYRIDVPLLALLSGSDAVAVYTSAYRVLDVATLLPATAAAAALPLLLAQPTRARLGAFASQYLELALVVGLLVSVLLTVTARPILAALYSDRYDAAYPTMVALAWAAGCTLVTNVFSPLAVALERRRLLLYANGVALVANITLNVALVPLLGALGAALATLVTELVVTAPLAWVGIRATGMHPRSRPLVAAVVATLAWLAALWYFAPTLGQGWLLALATLAVWLVVFAIITPTWALDIARELRMASRPASALAASAPDYPHADAFIEVAPAQERLATAALVVEEHRS